MRIAVLRERAPERRVALVPESCRKLIKAGFTIGVEADAGALAGYTDAMYADAGAEIAADPQSLALGADIVVKVNALATDDDRNEVAWLDRGTVVLGSLMPLRNLEDTEALAQSGARAFSTDAIPRTTRAQAMDTLSSMNSISGYKGVLLAAAELGKYFPMLSSAAGTVFPAKVFVIGAAVAGLQAIATAKRLGAQVTATDVRPEVKEQIESVGGKYVGIELGDDASAGGGYAKELTAEDQARQREMLVNEVAKADVVITTALIGGVFAPKLMNAEMVASMRPGSVIVDLAADGGCNVEVAVPGETTVVDGVTILAPLNLAATLPEHSSLLFSRNVTNFLDTFSEEGTFNYDAEDDILAGSLITDGGQIVHERTLDALKSN